MQDYETKGYTKYGAQMGRYSNLDGSFAGHVTLRRVPIDDGGYDPGGAYWGTGEPLFVLTNEDGDTAYFRASDFETAREHAATEFPEANIIEPSDITESDIAEMVEAYTMTGLSYSYATEQDRDTETDMASNYASFNLTEEAKTEVCRICETFARGNRTALLACIGKGDLTWDKAGTDLWHSQHRHGLGFNAGDWPEEYEDSLQESAEQFSEWSYFFTNDGETVGIEG